MANLLKMDIRRLFHSPMFIISLSVIAVFNIILNILIAVFSKLFGGAAVEPTLLSSTITSPFILPLFIIVMFASMINFSYADIVGGYIKNLAGQLPNKSKLIVSKFIVIGIHNFIFLFVGALTNLVSTIVLSAAGMISLIYDGAIPAAVFTLFLKWMLSMAISSILLFVTNGIKNKVLASVTGVIIGTGALGLAYLGLNTAITNIFHTYDFNLQMYMPDTLFGSVDVTTNTAVINAIIVSLVCTIIFMALTIKVFNSRDIK